ncbi:hypothetical protein DSL72_003784 [Monilinia vaccinii-corymbosi]|uniref:C2H2-type domain-containing protein n=1 Tax=Monilinia vaccinii-corymbosi TaxID=61207 RepID=A0A8A3NXQ1_9HELO|nr:hypothetical protein DSL72_003784 [Monilinia vaccinii-corymbosi]
MSQNRPQSGPYHCGYNGCTQTFTRRTGARRHETTVHGNKKFCCHEPDCNYRGGKRRNDFKRHMREKHPEHDDHLFIPENFSSPQESQSPIANCCQGPEIKYYSQVYGDFSQTSPLPSTSFDPRFNTIDINREPLTSTAIPLASAVIYQPYGIMTSPNTISLRPPDLHAFEVVNTPHPEFESVPAATTATGNTWGQVHPSIMCSTGLNLQDMSGMSVENGYETFDGEHDSSQYGQPANISDYKW